MYKYIAIIGIACTFFFAELYSCVTYALGQSVGVACNHRNTSFSIYFVCINHNIIGKLVEWILWLKCGVVSRILSQKKVLHVYCYNSFFKSYIEDGNNWVYYNIIMVVI